MSCNRYYLLNALSLTARVKKNKIKLDSYYRFYILKFLMLRLFRSGFSSQGQVCEIALEEK